MSQEQHFKVSFTDKFGVWSSIIFTAESRDAAMMLSEKAAEILGIRWKSLAPYVRETDIQSMRMTGTLIAATDERIIQPISDAHNVSLMAMCKEFFKDLFNSASVVQPTESDMQLMKRIDQMKKYHQKVEKLHRQ